MRANFLKQANGKPYVQVILNKKDILLLLETCMNMNENLMNYTDKRNTYHKGSTVVIHVERS